MRSSILAIGIVRESKRLLPCVDRSVCGHCPAGEIEVKFDRDDSAFFKMVDQVARLPRIVGQSIF